jgi:hypothetical protein
VNVPVGEIFYYWSKLEQESMQHQISSVAQRLLSNKKKSLVPRKVVLKFGWLNKDGVCVSVSVKRFVLLNQT